MRHIPAIILAGALVGAADAAPVRAGPVEAELVADVAAISPGQSFTLAFRMALDSPWHTYWINPGDSGLAPKLAWKLPPGFAVSDLQFPAPTAIATPPFMTYGLEGDVWFLATVTPPASLPPDPVVLAAEASWLICDKMCIPGSADLELSLPVNTGSVQVLSARAGEIEMARERLPQKSEGWRFHVREADGRVLLSVLPPAEMNGGISSAVFFPEQSDIIRHSAPQVWRRAGNGYVLELVPADAGIPPPGKLAGVLALGQADSRRSLHIQILFSEDSPRRAPTERKLP